ncbi:MAG TPA: S-layer protein [Candidatus Nanoarchaeia archaeon]|nr:S-layer protein [Candidatus Nanoarchaeia archaeon]
MPSKTYFLKEQDGKFLYSPAHILQNPSGLNVLDNELRLKILKTVSKVPKYPAEIAKELKVHEQKIYYHVKQLLNTGILEVAERKEIRGTTAKTLRPKELNFGVSLGGEWKELSSLGTSRIDKKLANFLYPFVVNDELNADIVVGSPDPHGAFKARARDSHYAINLSLFLGRYCNMPNDFSVKLDTDVNLKKTDKHLILVGGPVTNLLVSEVNKKLPIPFSEEQPWGIVSKKSRNKHSEDSVGIVAKISNPFKKDCSLLVFAGVRAVGTKAAVIALTKSHKTLLKEYADSGDFAKIVHGFDLDSDGKIDSVEILE